MKRIFRFFIALLMFATMLSGCGLDVPRPEIEKGEFAFSVTYEFKGETKTIDGVYVCEYDGVDWTLDGGWQREWKGYIKDGTTEEEILLEKTAEGHDVELNLYFDPSHLMDDSYNAEDEPFVPYMSVRVVSDEGMHFENDADIIAETYGAKIIDYTYDPPIENTFN